MVSSRGASPGVAQVPILRSLHLSSTIRVETHTHAYFCITIDSVGTFLSLCLSVGSFVHLRSLDSSLATHSQLQLNKTRLAVHTLVLVCTAPRDRLDLGSPDRAHASGLFWIHRVNIVRAALGSSCGT